MLPQLLTMRSMLADLRDSFVSVDSTPDLSSLRAMRDQIATLMARLIGSIKLTSFSTVYSFVIHWLMRIAKLGLEALDWLLLPRLAWKITVRHCLALLVLFCIKVAWRVALVPILRAIVNFARPFFVNAEYLKQEKLLQDRLDTACAYPDWKKAASELDRLQGRYHWKESSQSLHYDWRRIRDDLQRFRELVDAQDARGIMSFSRSRLLRNLVGINDRRLYTPLRAGTKRLIEEYISEVVRALQLVCVIDQPTASTIAEDGTVLDDTEQLPVSTAEKLSFFNETRHAFGRSALLLSGGATLGLYHIGVCKSLHENSLLPRVLSGSSVGSIICAMVGTRTDEELTDLFSPESNVIKLNFFPPNGGSARRKLTRLFTQGVLMDIRILKKCVKANVPPLTFQEAYELSGRIINIVVSPASGAGNKDSLRLLNYLTAPNVLVWSAALASCAIPGVYAPVELLKKDEKTGKLSPYMEGGAPVKWEDGSVQADLPMQRLSELFNINHFIVSQCNPHVVPFVSSASSSHSLQQSFLAAPISKLIDYLTSQLKATALNFLHLNMMPIHPSVSYVLDQKYLGDVTLVPNVSPFDYTQLLVNPTSERLRECVKQSEKTTWQLIATIRGACEIEFTLDECVRRMRGTLILEELTEAKKYNKHLSRVRSWSSDLLAVGQCHPPIRDVDDGDDSEDHDECTLPQSSGVIAARTQSAANLTQPFMLRTLTDRPQREAPRWKQQFEQPGVARAHTHANNTPARVSYNHEHQPEEDDLVSEEEEEEELRRKQLQAIASASESDTARGEGECPRCIDDEGIQRLRPVLTPQPSLVDVSEDNLAPPSEADIANASAAESAAAAAIKVSIDRVPSAVSLPAEGTTIAAPPAPANTCPQPRTLNSSLRSAKPRVAQPTQKRVNLFSPDPNHPLPPTDNSHARRMSDSSHTPAVAPAPASVSVRSRSHTPEEAGEDVKLSEAEWIEEKNSGRLTQLLKTTQTKVSVSNPPPPPKRNVRNMRASSSTGAGSIDVSLHIPSLVGFRHTPPRRMSAMDLAMLDQGSEDVAPVERKPSSHRHGTMATPTIESESDLEDAMLSCTPNDASDGESGGVGTLNRWLHSASTFFRRDSVDAARPTVTRSQSSTPAGNTPHETSDGEQSPTVAHPPQRSATHKELSRLAASYSPPTRVRHPLPASSSGAGGGAPTGAAPSRSVHSSPRLAASSRLRAHVLAGRLKGADSAPNPPATLLRAATSGLPRTLSQLELISDVTTMP